MRLALIVRIPVGLINILLYIACEQELLADLIQGSNLFPGLVGFLGYG